jgi:hypothetical protein
MLKLESGPAAHGLAYGEYNAGRLICPRAVAERLADWSDQARRAGRAERSDRLLIAAWAAYDRLKKMRAR